MKLPARRETRRSKEQWLGTSAALTMYVDVGFDPKSRRPLEIFIVAGKTGTLLNFAGHDLGELLSLALQHGHSIPALQARFKPDSLATFALALAAEMTAEFQAERPAR